MVKGRESVRITLYDTTLRDGAQREGISFSLDDKLKIARRLDRLGVAYIEGGWPGSNPKDMAFFQEAPALSLENAVVVAFGSTQRAGASAAEDANIQALVSANTPAVAVVGKSWDLHVQEVLNTYDVGVEVIGAYFQEISPPVEVAYAFRDVASAREDRNRIINEAEGYRNTILPTTRGLAQGIVSDAEGYSKERVERATGEADRFLALMAEYQKNKDLTASRIYVEKMEQILPYLRIYVVDQDDGKGISNLRLMLPRN